MDTRSPDGNQGRPWWPAGQVVQFAPMQAVPQQPAPLPPTPVCPEGGFQYNQADGWLEYRHAKKDWKRLCSPLAVLGRLRDERGARWDLLVRVLDADGREQKIVLGYDLITPPNGLQLTAALTQRGLAIEPESDVGTHIRRFLLLAGQLSPKVLRVDQVGWLSDRPAFALPGQTGYLIQPKTQHDQVYLTGDAARSALRSQGTLADWQTGTYARTRGNPLARFGVFVALAGPTLKLSGNSPIMYLIVGSSSTGKTTLLAVSASVWGEGGRPGGTSFVEAFTATPQALQRKAIERNDTLLVLDELGMQANAHGAGLAGLVFLLTGGRERGRLTQEGTPRAQASWRLMILASGNATIPELRAAMQKGDRGALDDALSGESVRCVDLDYAGLAAGVFDYTHGLEPAAFADALHDASRTAYGTAGPAFVQALLDAEDHAVKRLAALQTHFMSAVAARHPDLTAQAARVAKAFAVVYAAGAFAIERNVLPADNDDPLEGVAYVLKSWLETRGGGQLSIEERNALRRLQDLLERDQGFGSVCGNTGSHACYDTARQNGFRMPNGWYLVKPGVWGKIAGGMKPGGLAEALRKLDNQAFNVHSPERPGHLKSRWTINSKREFGYTVDRERVLALEL